MQRVGAVLAILLQQPLWAVSILLQALVTVVLIRHHYYRQLPRLTSYVALNVCQAILMLAAYARYGFYSHESRVFFWISEFITMLARVLAGFELIERVLEGYRGIWGLAWRLLTVTFLGVLSYATVESWSTWTAAAVSANRGFHLGFAVALVSCLVLIRYYCIPVPSVYKSLIGGFCFYSCMEVLRNTLLRALFAQYHFHFRYYQYFWDAATLLPFITMQVWWALALRRPVEAVLPLSVLPSPSDYRNLSPEINERLRRLNDVLGRFWKLRVVRS
jgi:hypothetical protein